MPYQDYNSQAHDNRRLQRSNLLDDNNKSDYVEEAPNNEEEDNHIDRLAGARALERALEEWKQEVVEPRATVRNGKILDDYIHEGIKWSWIKEYTNRKFAWCGAFCAFAWKDSISDEIRKKCFPSTYRLQQWAKNSTRIIDNLKDARPGDIIIVGHKKSYGDHITLFEKSDDKGYWSVEGNAFGETPSGGARKEGVIRRWRSEDEIHSIYRPLECDR